MSQTLMRMAALLLLSCSLENCISGMRHDVGSIPSTAISVISDVFDLDEAYDCTWDICRLSDMGGPVDEGWRRAANWKKSSPCCPSLMCVLLFSPSSFVVCCGLFL